MYGAVLTPGTSASGLGIIEINVEEILVVVKFMTGVKIKGHI